VKESDGDLRERLLYIAGDADRIVDEIINAKGPQLDELAWRYGLKRREVVN
jgi:hypothetical protein